VQSAIAEEATKLYATLQSAIEQQEKESKAEDDCSPAADCPSDPAAILLANSEGVGDDERELCVCMRELVLTNNTKNTNHAKGISVDVKAKIEESFAHSLRSIASALEHEKSTQKISAKAANER